MDLIHKLMKYILIRIFYILSTLFPEIDADLLTSIGTGQARVDNDFTFSFKPFTNNSWLDMSFGLNCLSNTILFSINCKPKEKLH